MKERNTIFFDLDGTLLPLNQEEFVKNYFGRLAVKMAPQGLGKEELIKGLMIGMKAMQDNDGTKTNSEAFWEVFEKLTNTKKEAVNEMLLEFYKNEFDAVKEVLTEDVNHRAMIDGLKQKGYDLVLSTNPLFPIEAVITRLSWIGLKEADFILITNYDNSAYCKPNLGYYKDILKQIGKTAEECIMIGNDTVEDLVAAQLGLKVGLVTTNLENSQNVDISTYLRGSIEEVVRLLTE